MTPARPLLLAALIPPLLTAGFVARFGVDLPYWDEWVHLQTLVKYEQGTLSWADVFAQYNESRKPVPRLLILGLALVGLSDQRVQMGLSVLLASCTLLAAALLLRHSAPAMLPWVRGLLLLTSSALLLAWSQWQNWLWGIQFICFLPLLGLMLTLLACVVERVPSWGKVAVAVTTAAAASFSFAAGLLLWPVNAVALVLLGRVRVAWLAVYVVAGGLAAWAYFTGYQRPAWVPTWGDALGEPLRLTHYLLVLAGAGLLPRETAVAAQFNPVALATVAGAALIGTGAVLAVLAVARAATGRRDPLGLAWALVFAYGVSALALAALGRSPMGLDTALLSRYATFSLPVAMSVVGLLAGLARRRAGRIAFAAVAGSCIAMVVLGSVAVVPRVEQVHRRQLTGRAMLTFCLTSPDARLTTFVADWPQHPLVVPTAVVLSARGWLHPPVSPDGDPAALPAAGRPARARLSGTTLILDDADVHTVLVVTPGPLPQVARVLHASVAFGTPTPLVELPPLPPGARLLALRGAELRTGPLELRAEATPGRPSPPALPPAGGPAGAVPDDALR
ncbi:MAG: hypothetical protein ACK4PI_00705 [Tepidisphaerales bacterium]